MATGTKTANAWVDEAVMHAMVHTERAKYFNRRCMQDHSYFQEAILRDRELAVEVETVIGRLRMSPLLAVEQDSTSGTSESS